jgi:hypothetical protein
MSVIVFRCGDLKRLSIADALVVRVEQEGTRCPIPMLSTTAGTSSGRSLAPASASATVALRFSLSSKATTSGGPLSFMHPQD